MATDEPGRGARVAATGGLRVEVAAGWPDYQEVLTLELPAGSTVTDAVLESGILERFPELRGIEVDCAVHGVRCAPERLLAEGDRVELLRPLRVDPRESRRRRARRPR